jgi:hypothetical protein
MATKPLSSTLPRYADTVAGDPSKVSEPPSGKKDIGWVVGEKPPAQWMNWLLLQCYNWLVWLDAFETEIHTWTKLQTFTASVLNTRAILATGNGSGSAIKGIGGAAGNGIEAEASGAGTYALYGKGTAIGVIGVRGEGGSGSVGGSFIGGGVSAGVSATAGSGGGNGINALGVLTGAGGSFQGGPTGVGVYGQGGATSGRGGDFVGGGTSSEGVRGTGGGPDGHGVAGQGTGSGVGVVGTGGLTNGDGGFFVGVGTGYGLRANGGVTSGYGALLTGGGTSSFALRAVGGGPNGGGIEAVGTGTGFAIDATGPIYTDNTLQADVSVRVGPGATHSDLLDSYALFTAPTHPVATQAIKGRVMPVNTARAWGYVTTDGIGGVTTNGAVGVTSVAITATTIDVTLADTMADANYSAVVSGNAALYASNKTTTVCKFTSSLNPQTTVLSIDFQIMGRQ